MQRKKQEEEENEEAEEEEEGTSFSIFAPNPNSTVNYKAAEMMKRSSRPPSPSSSSFGRLLMDGSPDRTPRTVPRGIYSVVPAFLLLALTSLLCFLVYLVADPMQFPPHPAAGGLLEKFGVGIKENVSGLSFESFDPFGIITPGTDKSGKLLHTKNMLDFLMQVCMGTRNH